LVFEGAVQVAFRAGLEREGDLHVVGLAITNVIVYDMSLCVTFFIRAFEHSRIVAENVSLEITT